MARVRVLDEPCQRFGKHTAPVKDKSYLTWLHSLPCIISHVSPVEAAHLSTPNENYGHLGRAKGRKASDCWALPLSKTLHDKQHKGNELRFWRSRNINPYIAALVLHNIYATQGNDGIETAQRMILHGLFQNIDNGESDE